MKSKSPDDARRTGQTRRQWRKPSLRRLSAGAAEVNFNVVADGLGGQS